jgi:hypothetical protein
MAAAVKASVAMMAKQFDNRLAGVVPQLACVPVERIFDAVSLGKSFMLNTKLSDLSGTSTNTASPCRTIAFEFSWQANVSGSCNDSIEASFVKGHDFSQAAIRPQKEAGL